ncbi:MULTISPECIES: cold-shock protein, partial [Streptomyces]|nr:hypothetical protein [Streptomyces roseolus]
MFLHASVLARTGATSVNPGATLKVRTGQGQKGPQVTEVLEVDESTASAAPPRAPRTGGFGDRPDRGDRGGFGGPRRGGFDSAPIPSGPEQAGTVKWY